MTLLTKIMNESTELIKRESVVDAPEKLVRHMAKYDLVMAIEALARLLVIEHHRASFSEAKYREVLLANRENEDQ